MGGYEKATHPGITTRPLLLLACGYKDSTLRGADRVSICKFVCVIVCCPFVPPLYFPCVPVSPCMRDRINNQILRNRPTGVDKLRPTRGNVFVASRLGLAAVAAVQQCFWENLVLCVFDAAGFVFLRALPTYCCIYMNQAALPHSSSLRSTCGAIHCQGMWIADATFGSKRAHVLRHSRGSYMQAGLSFSKI